MHTRIDSITKLQDDVTSKTRSEHTCSTAEQLLSYAVQHSDYWDKI